MKFGSITTGIIADGLVFNMDAANRASYVNGNTKAFNTTNLSQSGSFEGAPTFTPTLTGSYWHFDYVDDWIRIKDDQFPSNRTAFTCECIYKFWAIHGTYRVSAVSKWTSGGSSNTEWNLGGMNQNGPSPLSFTVYSADSSEFSRATSSMDYSVNTWYHHVGTFDGTNNGLLKSYINGVLHQSVESGYSACRTYSAQDVAIATYASGYGGLTKVNVSRFNYYNRALSAEEVLHNYNALKGRFGLT